MEIRRLSADEASSWSWDAANSIVETRMASGGLSRGGTTSLTRSVTSTFSRGIPYDMEVLVDSKGGWLWVEHANNARVIVRAGFLSKASDIGQWVSFITRECSGHKVSWRIWGPKDSLVPLVEALGAAPVSIVLRASISGLDTPSGASAVWLRAMGAGELMRFQVAASNERGEILAAAGEAASVEDGRREAFRRMERRLPDGVATPGHHLFSLCSDGRTVGGAWMEVDGGVAVVHSVVLDDGERRQGHRRAAVGALVATAHAQGARQLEITVTPSDYNFLDALLSVGMDIISVDYAQEFAFASVPAFQAI